jgi:acetate kinase
MNLLVLNGGSSSIKARVFGPNLEPLWQSKVDFHGLNGSRSDAIEPLIADAMHGREIHAAGHRIVHGGKKFRESTRITPEVKAGIAELASFAPEHNLLEVEAIETAEKVLAPATPQVAVFDTAFHATLAPEAYTYPGPYEWLGQGIRRYGFHGISHQYVSRRAAELLGTPLDSLRMITCHLGGGCSLAAILGGKSVDTTMGFTPLEGLMMGTRSGSVDPGILIHLVRHRGFAAEDLDRMLNKESGLKGISGLSDDMRDILSARQSGNERACLAFAIYVYRLASAISGLLPALGGLDALVFTGGVGENAAPVRSAAVERLRFLNIRIDSQRNQAALPEDAEISASGSAVRVIVVHTNEEREIARECLRVIAPGNGS